MAHDWDGEESSERHYRDGKFLHDKLGFDNAGYHYGLSAECVIKHLLVQKRVSWDDPVIRKYHFPALREAAIQAASGRGLGNMVKLLNNPSYMQHWTIRMRYRKNGSVDRKQAEKWRQDANRALGLLW